MLLIWAIVSILRNTSKKILLILGNTGIRRPHDDAR